MKKRLLAVVLVLCLALGTLPLSVLAAEYTATMNGKEIAVTTDADNKVTVSDADLNQYYTFTFVAGSGSDADKVTYYEKSTGATGELALTPKAAAKITITFTAGEGASVDPASVEIEAGAAIGRLPTPTREGFTFNGWFTAAQGGEEVTAGTTFDKAAAIYAQWTENAPGTVTVTFDVKGGSAVQAQTVESGKTAAKPADPTKEGFTFGGWYADETCVTAFDFQKAVTADTTVYAKWVAAGTFTVKFMDGDTVLETQTVKSGGTATKPSPNPTKSGYSFKGWFTEANGSTVFNFEGPITRETVVYAQWDMAAGTEKIEVSKGGDGAYKVEAADVKNLKDGTNQVVLELQENTEAKADLVVEKAVLDAVDTIVVAVTESATVSIPTAAAAVSANASLKVSFNAKDAKAPAGAPKAAACISFTLYEVKDGKPAEKTVKDLAVPITFSVKLDAAPKDGSVLAFWNGAKYIRTRGSLSGAQVTFRTRHLTEFAVVDAKDAEADALDVTPHGDGTAMAGALVKAEADEHVLAGYNFTYKDGSVGTTGATYGGNAVDPDTGLTVFAGHMSAPAGGKIGVKTVFAGTGEFEWDAEKGFSFNPANVIAAYGSPDDTEK